MPKPLPVTHRRYLVVMVKEPRPGRVKTRLGADIGMVPAAWWMRRQLAGVIRRLRDPRWQLVLAVAPDRAVDAACWPRDLWRVPQGDGDLGDRMKRVFQNAPPGPVCIVGADIPDLNRAHVARAFGALGGADVVFGPAPDGGYWLVGFKRVAATPSTLFTNVRWSSRHALNDTLRGLPGLRVALVDRLNDIDTAADLITTFPSDA